MPRPVRAEFVLVVDDDPLMQDVLELLLEERWPVLRARSAAEARAAMGREVVAVVIADQRMPGETGVDLLAWVWEHHPDTIRLLLTGFTDMDTVVEAINRGKVWHYIRKPWDNTEVLSLVQRAVEYRAAQIEGRRRYEGAVRSLVVALEASHPYTSGHSTRVTRYCRRLGQALGLTRRDLDTLVLAAQLHDIGKIGVDRHYLDKRGGLDPDERRDVQRHVLVGRRILAQTGFLDDLLPMVEAHHEHFDGAGYPGGLLGEQIPLGARIISVADSFDAMTSCRAYRDALPWSLAIAELRGCAGRQFDPALVEVFLGCLPEGPAEMEVTDPGLALEEVLGSGPGMRW
jgi:putative nucleotidyltransferase with HDIG domain